MMIPANLGLPTLVLREIGKYELHQQWGLLRGLLIWVSRVVVASAFACAALAVLLVLYVIDWESDTQATTLLWGFALIPIAALSQVRGAALQGLGHVVLGYLPEEVLRPVAFLCICTYLVLFSALTPSSAMASQAAGAFFAFAIGNVLLLRHIPRGANAATPSFQSAAWLRTILPFSVLAAVQVINSQTSIIVLMLASTPEDVGIYRVANQGANLLASLLAIIAVVLAPNVSRLHAVGDNAKLERLATYSAAAASVALAPIAVLLVLLGDRVVSFIFGLEFREAGLPLAILVVGQLANAIVGWGALILNMTGHETDAAKSFASITIVNIALSYLLVFWFGLPGAALASAGTLLAWHVVLSWQVYRRLGINTSPLLPRRRTA